MNATDQKRERRLRRDVSRLGYRLVKSRCRTPERLVYGTYGILDSDRNWWVAADREEGYGWDLDDIQGWLSEPAEQPP
ncbi:MAG: hypothetical protein ACLQBX_10930 [Candidatus Limnocylindrales bacterium]